MNLTNEQIYGMTDHTNLNKTATLEDIKRLCEEAKAYGAASVCVAPYFVRDAKKILEGSNVKTCTVIGFPNGYMTTHAKAMETVDAVNNGADEIDMVINIGEAANNNWDAVRRDIKIVANAIDASKRGCDIVLLKVIVETCLLTEEQILTMCDVCIEAGADYIKTSTGFDKEGANAYHIQIMKERIGDRDLKIKASGGIRTLVDAEKMIKAGADRIGASKIIPAVKES